jgi:Flp pilus assembly pilin Flp
MAQDANKRHVDRRTFGRLAMAAYLKLIRDTRGVGAIEYALIASLISVAAIASFNALGANVSAKYEQVDNKL